MSITVGFWNVQRLGSSSGNAAKKSAVQAWMRKKTPNLMFFSEVYSTAFGDIDDVNFGTTSRPLRYRKVNYVNTLDKNGAESGLCICLLKREINDGIENLAARPISFPGDKKQKRLTLKVTFEYSDITFYFFGVHANASKSGGESAYLSAIEYLKKEPKTAFIGDFNSDVSFLKGRHNDVMDWIIPAVGDNGEFLKVTQKSGGVLDYLVTRVTNNCPISATSSEMAPGKTPFASGIDHMPILYKIQPPQNNQT